MSWTQNICMKCWPKHNPNREPMKLLDPEEDVCCICGEKNKDGIYIRIDPKTVKFPKQ